MTQLLSTAEVCKLLRISRHTLYSLLRAKTRPLPVFGYVRRSPRFEEKTVLAWVQGDSRRKRRRAGGGAVAKIRARS